MSAPWTISDAEHDGWADDCLYAGQHDEQRADRYQDDPGREHPSSGEIEDGPRVVSRPSDLVSDLDFLRGVDLVLAEAERADF